jgi:hypothetical protein
VKPYEQALEIKPQLGPACELQILIVAIIIAPITNTISNIKKRQNPSLFAQPLEKRSAYRIIVIHLQSLKTVYCDDRHQFQISIPRKNGIEI